MGWGNPPIPWSELERRLAGRAKPGGHPPADGGSAGRIADGGSAGRIADGGSAGRIADGDGGDSPAWSRKRPHYERPDEPVEPFEPTRPAGAITDYVPYAELHCHSNFSFLDGASEPEELAEEAARLGIEALAITDHDGFYG